MGTRQHHPAFDSRYVVTEEKAIGAEFAEAPYFLTVIFSAVCLTTVFKNNEVMPIGYIHDGIHIARVAEEMDDHDDTSSRIDRILNRLRVNVVAVPLNVYENRKSASLSYREYRSRPGKGWCDDLILTLQPKHCQREKVRTGARIGQCREAARCTWPTSPQRP